MAKIVRLSVPLLLLLIVLLPLAAESGESGDLRPSQEFSQALGFQGGALSGTGLSYFRQGEKLSWQVAGGALYSPVSDQSFLANVLDYTIGVELHFPVYASVYKDWLEGQLYLFTGLNHRGTISKEYSVALEAEFAGEYTSKFGIGGGIGIELILFDHFSLPFEIGYGFFFLPTLGPNLADKLRINIVPQAGFRYRYN